MTDPIKEPMTGGTAGVITRRGLLLSLPGLALTRRLLGQAQAAPLGVRGLHQVTLAVSDLERSLDFYQGLFGMSVQARQGGKILLSIGDGPHFLALTEAGSEPPSIDHFGLAVENFDVDRVVRALAEHNVTPGGRGEGLSGGPMRVTFDHKERHTRAPYPAIPTALSFSYRIQRIAAEADRLATAAHLLSPHPQEDPSRSAG